MPVFSYYQARKALQEGKIPPFMFLHGEEWFLARELIRLARRKLEECWGSVEYLEWDEDSPAGDVGISLTTLPLVGGGRMVVVDSPSPAALESYRQIKNPRLLAVFIFRHGLKKDDGLVHRLAESGWVVECAPLKGRELERWMQAEAESRQKRLTRTAAEYLRFSCGDNPALIRHELEKVSLYLGPRVREISTAALQQVGSRSIGRSIFDLVDAVAARKRGAAGEIMRDLIGQGESPVRLLALLSRHFLQLLEAAWLLKEGVSPAALAEVMRVHPYAGKKLQQQVRFFTLPELEKALDSFLEIDRAVKQGQGEPVLLLESLLAEICR